MAKRNKTKPEDVEKLPPHCIPSEQGALSCVLYDPSRAESCLAMIVSRFGGRTDFFYDLRHQMIADAMISVRKSGEPIDVITVQQWLNNEGSLDTAGGISYLNSLPDITPSPANLPAYLDQIEAKYKARTLIHLCSKYSAEAFELNDESDEFFSRARFAFETLLPKRVVSGKFIAVDELDNYDTKNDPNNRIGNRWLCVSGKLLIPAASGAGKSTLNMQMLTLFALGMNFCGIEPHGPHEDSHLTSLIIGDENDIGDLAEQFQGTRDFLIDNGLYDQDTLQKLKERMTFWHAPALTNQAFLDAIETELKARPRNICAIDPLVSFAGVNLSEQTEAAQFLRQGLTRIAETTGVIFFVIHHTTKPTRDSNKFAKEKITSQFQYSGAGSYDIAGWARAVMTLDESSDGVFRLVFSKRGKRAGATHPDGTPATTLWMRHSDKGLHWVQTNPPTEPEPTDEHNPGGKPSKVNSIAASNLASFCLECKPEGEGMNQIAKRLMQWQSKHGTEYRVVSIATAKRAIEALTVNQKLAYDADSGLFKKGPNA